jgi:hypothetical protein
MSGTRTGGPTDGRGVFFSNDAAGVLFLSGCFQVRPGYLHELCHDSAL